MRITTRSARFIAVGVALGVLGLAYWSGVFDTLGAPRTLRDSLVQLGAWGYVAFIATFAVLQPCGVPGSVWVFAAPLIWPWPIAFALSMIGAIAASIVGFSFARFIARDWVATKIPERFAKWAHALERHAVATIFVLRLVFWTAPLLHGFFGVSRVRFATHIGASTAAYAAPFLVVSYFGQELVEGLWEAAMHVPVEVGIALGVVLVAVGIAAVVARRRRARRRARGAPPLADAASTPAHPTLGP